MPKLKGETDAQWMQRLRDFRADREDMMRHTRAAVGYVNACGGDEGLKLAAFMHLFHPEAPAEQVREMAQAMKRKD